MLAGLFLLSIQSFLIAQVADTSQDDFETSSQESEEDPQDAPDESELDIIQEINCETLGRDLTLSPDEPRRVQCPESCPLETSIWGTTQYTDDSSVCVAAMHAGVSAQEDEGISVYPSDQTELFVGSSKNDIRSESSGRWTAGFQFTPSAPAKEPLLLTCPSTLKSLGSSAIAPGAVLEVQCPSKCDRNQVWGTSYYTNDSSICTAAIHAGALPLQGGMVRVYAAPGQPAYLGSEQNGISTSNWGSWSGSFMFANAFTPDDATEFDCKGTAQTLGDEVGSQATVFCPPGCDQRENPWDFEIWGFELYSDDSSICRAAIHAGLLSPRGGAVTVEIQPWVDYLEGKEQNGILSRSWGPWYRTYDFVR